MPRPRRTPDEAPPPPGTTPPGTTPRGAARRQQLVDAATAILAASGFDAVSHRAVATAAGLPLAATTYYFATLDDLRAAALSQLGRAYVDGARRIAARMRPAQRTAEEVATLLVALVAGDGHQTDPAHLLTFYERYVQAGRHPALRGMVRGWTAELGLLAGVVLARSGYPADADLSRLLIAAIDGLLLDALIDGDAAAPARAADGVARLLHRTVPAAPSA
ncbi:MAG: TetR family transcriptional regulator [Chloroflexi bacterium]|nr:TetR family transcriptional regulator [Chloroflexota bacterium]